ALLALAWPGWLHGNASELYHVGYTVELEHDLYLDNLADRLHKWHQQGQLRPDQGFNLTPDASNQLAWLCPEGMERGFFDNRLDRYSPETAEEYVRLRQA